MTNVPLEAVPEGGPPVDVGVEVLKAGRAAERSRGAERWSVLRLLFAVSDLGAGLVGGAFVAVIAGAPLARGLLFVGALAALWLLLTYSLGLYAGDDLRSWVSGVGEIPRLLVACFVLSWPVLGIASALDFPRPEHAALVSIPLLALATGSARAGSRAFAHRLDPLRQRTLIVGSGYVAGQIATKLVQSEQYGLVPIGIVDDEIHEIGTPDLPRLGRLEDLSMVLRQQAVDRVIIAFSRASHEQLLESIRACRDCRVAVDIVPRLFEFLEGARALDQIAGLPLLSIGAPRLTRTSKVAKRCLDVVAAAAILLAISPLLALIAVAIKLESRGPVFFRQARVGQHRRTIRVSKFRSMYAGADERKPDLLGANDIDDGVMFKIRSDPRVTRVGRLLRRFSLDELPQLLNVLRGEMSLVGPRPLIQAEIAALAEDWHERRLDLRPGLTGPWQISGRSDVPFQEMVRFDYQYVAGWSLVRDLEILCATVPAVLSGRGAY